MSPKVFKYYIHDGISECRLQLLGNFTEADVPEIDGCWQTARTVLGERKLVLDLRLLESADHAGKIWLASLASQGAVMLPENSKASANKASLLSSLSRALRIADAEPSTPTR